MTVQLLTNMNSCCSYVHFAGRRPQSSFHSSLVEAFTWALWWGCNTARSSLSPDPCELVAETSLRCRSLFTWLSSHLLRRSCARCSYWSKTLQCLFQEIYQSWSQRGAEFLTKWPGLGWSSKSAPHEPSWGLVCDLSSRSCWCRAALRKVPSAYSGSLQAFSFGSWRCGIARFQKRPYRDRCCLAGFLQYWSSACPYWQTLLFYSGLAGLPKTKHNFRLKKLISTDQASLDSKATSPCCEMM